ncbi:MAG: hypothetical protein ACRDJE_09120 [Dehalococcoidia bacterium]
MKYGRHMKGGKNGHKRNRRTVQLPLPDGNTLPIEVVSDQEAEEADYVICCTIGMPRYFSDDVETTCAICGAGIFHRPHAPKKPAKICERCALLLPRDESAT